MKFIDAEQVRRLLDYKILIDWLEQAHREDFDGLDRLLMEQLSRSGGSNHLLIWPAWQRERALGVKLVTSFPDNPSGEAGLPAVQGIYALFDGAGGRPLACIDGAALTLKKTAADSALGARFLARKDAESLLIVGAGALAPHLIAAHRVARPSIRRVTVWNRTTEKAERLVEAMRPDGADLSVAVDLEAAARRADVICCATGATRPLIEGRWLKPGAHLDLVGGYTPAMREADDEAARRGRLYVDSRWFTLGCCGDLTGPMAAGLITEQSIVGDLFQLCRGERPGRERDDQITWFKNAGGAHLDLMAARCVFMRSAASESFEDSAD